MVAYLELYLDLITGDYLIQRYSEYYGVGKLVHVSATEMRERGLEILLSHLKNEHGADPQQSEFAAFSTEQMNAFYRRHHHVFVDLTEEGVISTGPLRRQGSGFVAPKNEVIAICPPVTIEKLSDALRRAFDAFK